MKGDRDVLEDLYSQHAPSRRTPTQIITNTLPLTLPVERERDDRSGYQHALTSRPLTTDTARTTTPPHSQTQRGSAETPASELGERPPWEVQKGGSTQDLRAWETDTARLASCPENNSLGEAKEGEETEASSNRERNWNGNTSPFEEPEESSTAASGGCPSPSLVAVKEEVDEERAAPKAEVVDRMNEGTTEMKKARKQRTTNNS